MVPFRINFDINTTSNKTAIAEAMVLRETKTTQIVYIPKIIDKGTDWSDSIEGWFVARRKGINDKWEEIDGISLSKLKKGEWTKFEIHSDELLNALEYSEKLRALCMKEKSLNKIQNKQVLILDDDDNKEEIIELLKVLKNSNSYLDILKIMMEDEKNWNNIIQFLCQNDNKEKFLEVFKNLDMSNQDKLFNILNTERINPNIIKENLDSSDENFWQKLFTKKPQLLYCAIPSLLQIISGQAYMGAKSINNTGASLADFVARNGIDNIAIIEIKTPNTAIIGEQYRGNVYGPSKELTKAIVQIKEQQDSFMKNYQSIKLKSQEEGNDFNAFAPKCYLIIGKIEGLDIIQIKSLNLYRSELRNVEIITFDELYEKLNLIYSMLTS